MSQLWCMVLDHSHVCMSRRPVSIHSKPEHMSAAWSVGSEPDNAHVPATLREKPLQEGPGSARRCEREYTESSARLRHVCWVRYPSGRQCGHVASLDADTRSPEKGGYNKLIYILERLTRRMYTILAPPKYFPERKLCRSASSRPLKI